MHKTDVDNIVSNDNGILINVSKNSDYKKMRLKAIEEKRDKERINNLESEMASIKSLLKQILSKVN